MHAYTLHEWFARSAAKYPDRIAADFAGGSLSYRELAGAANAVAAEIVRLLGHVPRRVGLLADRTPQTFAGYLGVQRLGATVVPLNPANPAARTAEICGLAGLDLVITDCTAPDQADRLPVPVLALAAVPGAPEPQDEALLPPEPDDPDSVAYILFTSGSTGRPKGVPITHRHFSAFLEHLIERYHVGPDSRFSHTFGLSFDASAYDLFGAWGTGGALIVPRRAELHDPVEYAAARGITHWHSVPSLVTIAQELGKVPEGRITDLRYTLFGGEQLTVQQCEAWRRAAPATQIHNNYGPTELTVTCTAYLVPEDRSQWMTTPNDTVPIGTLYGRMEAIVVDEDGRLTREGELCVRGPQRFDGYLDPAENQGRFVVLEGDTARPVDAGEEITPDHWYRTGDRVRTDEGQFVHLGRLDHQVKILGHRVELGEIEAALRRLPDVTQAVVLALPAGESVELTAVYAGREIPSRELIRGLRETLPRHMLPRHVHHMAALPLNGNGKIDRNLLARQLA